MFETFLAHVAPQKYLVLRKVKSYFTVVFLNNTQVAFIFGRDTCLWCDVFDVISRAVEVLIF